MDLRSNLLGLFRGSVEFFSAKIRVLTPSRKKVTAIPLREISDKFSKKNKEVKTESVLREISCVKTPYDAILLPQLTEVQKHKVTFF